jgi:hypothetical protein
MAMIEVDPNTDKPILPAVGGLVEVDPKTDEPLAPEPGGLVEVDPETDLPLDNKPMEPSASHLERILQGLSFDKGAIEQLKRSPIGKGFEWAAGTGGHGGRLGLSEDSQKKLAAVGILPNYETGETGLLRSFNEAVIQPSAAVIDGMARVINGALGFGAGFVGQVAGDVGAADSADRAARSLYDMGQAALIVAGSGPTMVSSPRVSITGAIEDVPVRTGAPTPLDFRRASELLTSEGGNPTVVETQLRNLYRDKGLLPEEILADASENVVVYQQLLTGETPNIYRPAEQPLARTAGDPVAATKNTIPPETSPSTPADFTLGTGIIKPVNKDGVYADVEIQHRYLVAEDSSALRNDGSPPTWTVTRLTVEDGKNVARLVLADDGVFYPMKNNRETVDAKRFTSQEEANAAARSSAEEYLARKAKNAAEDAAAEGGNAGAARNPASGTGQPPPPGSLAEAHARISAKIVSTPERKGEPLTFQSWYTKALDDLNPLNEARKRAKEMGVDLTVSQDPYILGRMTRGTQGRGDTYLRQGAYDLETYAPTGESFEAIMTDVVRQGGNIEEFRNFAAAKRAVEDLSQKGAESGLDGPAARRIVADQSARYQPLVDRLVAYSNGLTNELLKAGVISPEAHALMIAENKNFVPFYRLLDNDGAGGPGTGGGLAAQNPIRAIRGSEREIIDPLESIIKNTYTYIALAERNRVGRAFLQMADRTGAPTEFYRPTTHTMRVQITADEMSAFLGRNNITAIPDTVLEVFRGTRGPLAKNEIAVFDNGARRVFEVDPEIATVFNNTDAQTMGLIARIMAAPARTLRAGAVLNPDFLLSNLLRDQFSATIQAGSVPVYDTMRGLFSLIRRDEAFTQWLRSGGANAELMALDRRYLRQNLSELSRETGLFERGWNVVNSPITFLRAAQDLAENATRLGVFRRNLRGAAPDDVLSAAYASREGTVDFARIGAKTRVLNQVSAFFNARFQGPDRAIRALTEHPVKTTFLATATIAVPTLLNWWVNHDDPRYADAPGWMKFGFWVIPTDNWRAAKNAKEFGGFHQKLRRTNSNGVREVNDGTIWRIPKPFDYGHLFGSIPEMLLDAYMKKDPAIAKQLGAAIGGTYLSSPLPTALVPPIEQWSNTSTFTGSRVIPYSLEGTLPEIQHTHHTSQTTQILGKIIGAFPGMDKAVQTGGFPGGVARALTSPILMENYIRGWTGGMGKTTLQLIDELLYNSGAAVDRRAAQSLPEQIPGIRAFIMRYPDGNATPIEKFYDQSSKHRVVLKSIETATKAGDIETAKDLRERFGVTPDLEGVRDTISQLNYAIRNIHQIKPEYMSKEEKRQNIDTLYMRMLEMASYGNTLFDQIEEALAKKPPARKTQPVPDIRLPEYPGVAPYTIK